MGRTGTGWQSDVARQVVGRRRWDDTGRLSMAADPRLLAAHNIQPLSFFFLLFFSIFFALFIALFVVCVLSDVYRFVSLEKSIVGRPRVPLRGLLFFLMCVCVVVSFVPGGVFQDRSERGEGKIRTSLDLIGWFHAVEFEPKNQVNKKQIIHGKLFIIDEHVLKDETEQNWLDAFRSSFVDFKTIIILKN